METSDNQIYIQFPGENKQIVISSDSPNLEPLYEVIIKHLQNNDLDLTQIKVSGPANFDTEIFRTAIVDTIEETKASLKINKVKYDEQIKKLSINSQGSSNQSKQ